MSAHLGTGFALPLTPDGAFRTVSGAEAVAQSLRGLLLTEPGERVMRPDYGVGLRRFLFAPNTAATRTLIQHAVLDAIEAFEPRVEVEAVTVSSDSATPTRLDIELRYTLIGEAAPRNLVHPFYLDGSGS